MILGSIPFDLVATRKIELPLFMMHPATIKILGFSYFVFVLIVCLSACTTKSSESGPVASRSELASHFIDAFYSFNRDSLERLLMDAPESQPEILYYQKWAECASYKVLDRSHVLVKNDSLVIFPVTVKDDLMAALEIDFNVTDTFHISFRNGKIRSVKTSSNDPKLYYEAKD